MILGAPAVDRAESSASNVYSRVTVQEMEVDEPATQTTRVADMAAHLRCLWSLLRRDER
jgi:hypothetical protein